MMIYWKLFGTFVLLHKHIVDKDPLDLVNKELGEIFQCNNKGLCLLWKTKYALKWVPVLSRRTLISCWRTQTGLDLGPTVSWGNQDGCSSNTS